MATLNIKIGKGGIEKVSSDTFTIADINDASELVKASATATRLLHDSVIEYFQGEPPVTDEPEVLLPAFEDGMPDFPRKLRIQVGNGPRSPFEDAPRWFVDSVKRVFSNNYMWANAEELPGGEGEAAVMVFQSEMPKSWLEHWGFVGVGCDEDGFGGEEVLVSEPYGISLAQIAELVPFFEKLGWTFNIVGKSAHYPSAAIRIEIRPVIREGQYAA